MNKSYWALVIAVMFVWTVVGFLIGIVCGANEMESSYQQQALRRGYAEIINGNWEWRKSHESVDRR
jgi:hypothetical protein